MTKRNFFFQSEGGGQECSILIDESKTVKELINNYLEGKNLKNALNDFAFMVGANPLKKDRFINTPIKHLRFLRTNTIIKVREVDTKAGGRF